MIWGVYVTNISRQGGGYVIAQTKQNGGRGRHEVPQLALRAELKVESVQCRRGERRRTFTWTYIRLARKLIDRKIYNETKGSSCHFHFELLLLLKNQI